MLAILPLVGALLLFLLFQQRNNNWRESLLLSAVGWGLLVTLITETLSLFKAISLAPLAATWLTIDLLLLFWVIKAKKKISWPIAEAASIRKPELLLPLLAILAIIVTIGITAIICPPNNGDGMTYHMSRVVHWMQNRSIAHYPTHIIRQINMNPWAEYAIMHLQVLAQSDRLANLIQWFSLLGSTVAVTLIAQLYGADLRAQIFTAVVCVTIPMGILQGASSQNDYVIAFWLVCFVYFILSLLKAPQVNWLLVLATGASLGLAILTKTLTYIYAFPFVIWFALVMFRSRAAVLSYWRPALVISVLTLSINSGHYARHISLFGSPLGSSIEVLDSGRTVNYLNETFTIKTLVTNVAKNLALHTVTSNRELFDYSEKALNVIHNSLGVDIRDARLNWPGVAYKPWLLKYITSEHAAGNAFHLILIIVTSLIALFNRSLRGLLIYLGVLTAAFLLYCLLIKWSPWNSRYHLPIFILWAPAVAIVLAGIKQRLIVTTLIATLLGSSMIWVCYSQSRPLLGQQSILSASRQEAYFIEGENVYTQYSLAADFIRQQNYRSIGLYLSGYDWQKWEYALWVLLEDVPQLRIEHIDVDNISQAAHLAPFQPEAVVCIECDEDKIAKYSAQVGPPHTFGWVTVFGK